MNNEFKKQINGIAIYYPRSIAPRVISYKVEYALCPNIIENHLEYLNTKNCSVARQMSVPYNPNIGTNIF
jgi:hypothetical protein